MVVVVTVPAGSDIKIPCYRKRKNIIVIVISIFILIALVALASVLAALFIAKDAGKGILFVIYRLICEYELTHIIPYPIL